MMNKRKTYNFSKLFCLTVIAALSFNYVFDGLLRNYFVLNPGLISSHFELWRLVTFPLTGNTIAGTFLFIFTFWLVSPKIEDLLQKGIYPFVIFLLILMQGIVTTLSFWTKNIPFAGAEGITFFVLTLYTLIQRRKRVIVWGLNPMKLELLFILLLSVWVTFVGLQSLFTKSINLLLTNGTSATYGIVSGLLVFFQIKIIQNFKTVKPQEDANLPLTEDENFSHALVEKTEIKKQANQASDELTNYFTDYYSEDRLNEILDKMIAGGKESLSEEELRYLKDYSDFLNT